MDRKLRNTLQSGKNAAKLSSTSSKRHKQKCAGQCKLNRLLEGPIRTYPGNASLIQFFHVSFLDGHIKRDSTALVEEERHHSYQDLDEISTKLAALIKQQIEHAGLQNINPDGDTVIGVCIPPSEKLIFILFAILKLGAAYVPFDNSFPEDRIVKITKTCSPILIISDSHQHTFSKFDPVHDITRVVDVEKLFAIIAKDNRPIDEIILDTFPSKIDSLSERIAAVLFTSGSSGEAKGVRLSNRTILNRLNWQWQEFPFKKGENCCLKTALSFVDSIPEIFGPLLQGIPLYLFDKHVTSQPNLLIQKLDDYKITRVVLVPSLLRAILHTLEFLGEDGKDLLDNVSLWISSGESLGKDLMVAFFTRFPTSKVLCNFYGSTETMGDVTCHKFESMNDVENQTDKVHVPIGNCVYNTLIYVLDKHHELVPEGQSGELYIAGHNIATGYVGIVNSDKFINNPFTKTNGFTKLFRTGDFGHILKPKTGIRTLFYDGRTDSQVKIRGFRLDLSEIEATINSKIQLVQKCVVLCYKPGIQDQAIVAFIIPQEDVTIARLDMMFKLTLRTYEVPEVRLIKEIPLLVNGKIDRQRLLEMYENEKTNRTPFDDWHLLKIPEDQLEALKKVVEVISEVTGVSQHDIIRDLDDSFYNLGGTSLNSIVVITKLRENGLEISLTDFLSSKSVRHIVEIVVNNKTSPVANIGEFGAVGVSQGAKELYYTELLSPDHHPDAINIIAYSFSHKGDLETYTHATYDEFVIALRSIWSDLLEKNCSFVIRRKKDKKIIAVGLNFDAYDEPKKMLASQGIQYCLDFVDHVEDKQRDKLPKGIGKVWHSFMMGTHEEIDDADNVILITYMEEENIRLAREKNFTGILTTNTNPLTQQICSELHGYEVLFEYQVNQYQTKDGIHPFKLAPDSEKAICAWKKLPAQRGSLPFPS